jgi:hypothetical protein
MPTLRPQTFLALGLLVMVATLQAEEKPAPEATTDEAKADTAPRVDRRKIARKVSIEFVDTPLQEALTFLQTVSKVGIILDPRAATKVAGRKINLRVTEMLLDEVLDKICKEAGLAWDTRGPVYISTPEALQTSVELAIYDVKDLGAAEGAPDLAQKIRELKPDLWKDASVSIEEQGGKLVVMQRPEVHKEIQAYLEGLRVKNAKDEAAGAEKIKP